MDALVQRPFLGTVTHVEVTGSSGDGNANPRVKNEQITVS